MFRFLAMILPRLPKLYRVEHHVLRHPVLCRRSHRHLIFALAIGVGLGVVEPALNPPAAEACFFWQACARSRGRATNTRAGGKRTGRLIGGNDASVPYIISPRNAWIRRPNSHQPYTIRWNPVEGAHRYTVRIWRWTLERDRPEMALWEGTTVDNTPHLAFPPLIPLDPGNYYSIEVVTDTGVSSDLDEGYYESGFQLLFEEDYEELRAQLNNVAPTGSDGSAIVDESPTQEVTLARAGVFFLEEMYADALIILQSLADSPAASDLVYTALGDTYSQTGLNQLAIEAYSQALALAVANADTLSEAIIRVNLADVYATLGLFDNTLQHLRQARDAYEQIGEDREIARLDRRIELISTRLVRQDQEEVTP
ncbi:tetratricopeptide repeat protein [Leptothoe spongobia]|uniref:Tetratricopeptide repeat protein n=1 Tax=Leptothoe spongobia TAU-MAC 1115 TaxID=1967444 RepID=A0A947DG04_9CYAN|nr:tetratricopeptide repeat protein [Leptothoe spongobia]MBT9315888.1 tetratricopeptide repeat protein [Leptothoe spongobia TAU-MAC 1115]